MCALPVAEKHGNDNQPTQIICKFFLEAVEKKQYGWFWQVRWFVGASVPGFESCV